MTRRQLYRHGDYATTLEISLPLADEGNRAASAANLGAFFADGQGDYAEAESWFRMAADQGLAESQFNLGRLVSEWQGCAAGLSPVRDCGIGVPPGTVTPVPSSTSAPCTPMAKACPRDYVKRRTSGWTCRANPAVAVRVAANWRVNGRDRIATRMTPAQVAEAREHSPRPGSRSEPAVTTCFDAIRQRPAVIKSVPRSGAAGRLRASVDPFVASADYAVVVRCIGTNLCVTELGRDVSIGAAPSEVTFGGIDLA